VRKRVPVAPSDAADEIVREFVLPQVMSRRSMLLKVFVLPQVIVRAVPMTELDTSPRFVALLKFTVRLLVTVISPAKVRVSVFAAVPVRVRL
jgi:hypothetical protein